VIQTWDWDGGKELGAPEARARRRATGERKGIPRHRSTGRHAGWVETDRVRPANIASQITSRHITISIIGFYHFQVREQKFSGSTAMRGFYLLLHQSSGFLRAQMRGAISWPPHTDKHKRCPPAPDYVTLRSNCIPSVTCRSRLQVRQVPNASIALPGIAFSNSRMAQATNSIAMRGSEKE